MKKFIVKTLFFVVPFFALYAITIIYYSPTQGPDLIRLGYIPNIYKDYRSVFNKEYNNKTHYRQIVNNRKIEAEILVTGDSFADQGSSGFVNYLAKEYQVTYMKRLLDKNQLQNLFGMVNGDFFERNSVKYVIIENVERNFVNNIDGIDVERKIFQKQLDSMYKTSDSPVAKYNTLFFSQKTVKFPLEIVRYFFDKNYLANDRVHNMELTNSMFFSNNVGKLLFLHDDIKSLNVNNNKEKVKALNDILNVLSDKLRAKNVQLIVLPAPDKYNIYYDQIADKSNLQRPMFFDYLSSLKKKYIYVDSKKILLHKIKIEKDLYYFDDTHWSPVASKLIASEIHRLIKQNKILNKL